MVFCMGPNPWLMALESMVWSHGFGPVVFFISPR